MTRIAHETQTLAGGRQFSHSIQDVSDLARGFESPVAQVNAGQADTCDPDQHGGGKSWYGEEDFTKARASQILADGWKQGADKLEALKREIQIEIPPSMDRRRKLVWHESDGELSIDRALAGDLDRPFRSARRQVTRAPSTIDIYVAWGGNCDRTADELFWNGAAMLVVADLLENAGYSVRLIASMITASNAIKGTHRADVIVKDSHEPLRVDAIAGVVCHAGIFRTFGFREICRAPFDVGYGLGHSTSLRDLPDGARPSDSEAIVMDHVFDRTSALHEIDQAIKRIGDMRSEA